MIAGVILWFVVPVCFFIAGIAYLVHRKRKHERWLRQRHEIILARAAIQSERWDRQILLEQRTAIVDEEVLPIHPLSSHPFDRQETATQDRRDVLSKVIPSGVVLKTSDEEVVGDFPGIDELLDIDISCAICLVDYCHGEKIRTSSRGCHHVFHEQCILTWLEQHNECPCCRAEVLHSGDNAAFIADGNNEHNGHNEHNGQVSSYDFEEVRPLSNLFPSFLDPHDRAEYISSLISIGTTAVELSEEGQLQRIVNFGDGEERLELAQNSDPCFICNQPYELNCTLGRSPNPNCRHHFHEACVVHHLIHSTDCPQCSQQFVSVDGVYHDVDTNV